MKVAIIGSGYVGLVAGACFSDTGVHVVCVDNNEEKLNQLRHGQIPFFEPGLSDMVKRNWPKRLNFSNNLEASIRYCSAIFIAVGTPPNEDGSADLSHVIKVAKEIASLITHDVVLVLKSTVPVGTNKLISELVKGITSFKISVVSNPEFLKEGDAINDFLKPERVIIGTSSNEAREIMHRLYEPFVKRQDCIKFMNEESAEIVKYASNAFLATKISFINEIAELCEVTGADIEHIRIGMGADSRIGYQFLYPGLGFGGSCFPKDLRALVKTCLDHKVRCDVATSALIANNYPVHTLVRKMKKNLHDLSGKTITVWGLSFKPNTDDIRESPAIKLIQQLILNGATIKATDPEALFTARTELESIGIIDKIKLFEDEYEACIDSDALVLAVEWPKYKNPDFVGMYHRMKMHHIYDGRNILNKESVLEAGFLYHAIGR